MIKNEKIVYSFSRLGTYNHCAYEYKLQYIDKIKGRENIYTHLGTLVHDILEGIYNNEIQENELKERFLNGYNKIKSLGYKFPSDLIEENWILSIGNFVDNFKKDEGKFENERYFLVDVEGYLFQGYIDKIIYNDDGTIDIHDYKTSSKFSSKDLQEKGNQLLLYAIAMEKEGLKVNKLYWNMLKYVRVKTKWDTKRTPDGKLIERNKLWSEIRDKIIKAYNEIGIDEIEAFNKWVELSKQDLNIIPDEIKDYIKILDGLVEYEYNIDNLEFLKTYIKETIEKLENDKEYKSNKIDSKTSFYCSNLCGQALNCETYKRYIENLPDKQMIEIFGENTNISLRDFFE